MTTTLTIFCEDCQVPISSADLADPRIVGALLMLAHTAEGHRGTHRLSAKLDGAPMGQEGPLAVQVRCLANGCAAKPPSVFHVPPEHVAAVVLLHHAAHESHPMELTVDGKVYRV